MGLSRRDVLRSAGGAVGAAAAGAPSVAVAARGRRERAFSMAMHVHSSFSEGTGSMQAQLRQAQALGVDVVWWTDHDFRLQAAGYWDAVGFDGPEEVRAGVEWTWTPTSEGRLAEGSVTYVPALAPDEPGRAMQVLARSDGGTATQLAEAAAWNSTYTRTLAATVLELDVRLDRDDGTDGEAVVRVVSSYRPATAGRPAGTYVLEYRLGAGAGRWLEDDGLTAVVGLAGAPGSRSRIELDLQDDLARAWPDLVSVDAGLVRLLVGARSRGAAATARFDRLRFRRGRTAGRQPLVLQQEAMTAYRAAFPEVVQHQGSEISLVRHLNAYGGDLTLPANDVEVPRKVVSESATRRMVRRMRANGSVVALNHPLGEAGGGAGLADLLVRTRALGADLVEVGVKSGTEVALGAFDAAARNLVLVTATGTNDDHDGLDWGTQTQRWLTSVWAGSRSERDLLRALRGGRAWFWDPQRWAGTLDLRVTAAALARPALMGQVAVTRAASVRVAVRAPGAPGDLRLGLVVGRVDPTGRDGVTARTTTRDLVVRDGVAAVGLRLRHSTWVRVEARAADGTLVASGNPTWLLKETPAGGVPRVRRP